MESILKWSFEQNRYRYIDFGYRNAHYETKSAKIAGNPQFLGESSCNDIIISQKCHVLVRKMRRREISANYLCKKEQPCWKTEKLPHLRISNSNISVMAPYFKPKIEIYTDFTVIWRWYERLGTAFSGFWVKIGGWCGSRAHGSRSKYLEISVFLDFRWCWMHVIFKKQRNLTDTSHENW